MKSWKDIERHPLSKEFKDISGVAWEEFCQRMKRIGFRKENPIYLHERKVIVGWQRFRACLATDTEPVFEPMPDDITAEEFVGLMDESRRHESETERQARRERVAVKREEGKSIRLIAEEEEISPATVRRDIEVGQVCGGGTPEPPDGKVLGRDGKKQSATKAKGPMCERCERVGKVKNCPMCQEMRDKKPRKPKAESAEDAPVDAFRNEIPKGRRNVYGDPWIQETIDFIAVTEEAIRKQRILDGMAKRGKHYPYIISKDVIDGIGQVMNVLESVRDHLKENRPAGICPDCEGKGCASCKMAGLVPRERYQELKGKK